MQAWCEQSEWGNAPAGWSAADHHGDAPRLDAVEYNADASGQPFTEARLDALRIEASTANGESNRADFTCGAKIEPTTRPTHRLTRCRNTKPAPL